MDVVDTLNRDSDLCTTFLRIVHHCAPRQLIEPNLQIHLKEPSKHKQESNKKRTESRPKIHATTKTETKAEQKAARQISKPKISEIVKKIEEKSESQQIEKIDQKSNSTTKPDKKSSQNPKEPVCNPEKEVVISGVPYSTAEDLKAIVTKMASNKGVEVNEGDIIRTFRILKRKGPQPGQTPKIVVEWATNQKKNEFKNYKKSQAPSEDAEKPKTFISENLTPDQRFLFYKARQLKARFPDDLSHVWTRDGKCFVRMTNGSELKHRIKSLKDYEAIYRYLADKYWFEWGHTQQEADEAALELD